MGAARERPIRAATWASSRDTIRSASSARPCWASHRGDSGMAARSTQTNAAARAPASITHRQPATPNGACGTSSQQASATIGTAANCTAWFTAKARPRRAGGVSSVIVGVDGHQLDADADPGDQSPDVQADGCGLAGHDQGGGGVPQQR